MATVVTKLDVERCADDAFADVHFPERQSVVTGGHLESGEPVVGAKCLTTRKIGGRQREVTSRLIVFDLPGVSTEFGG